MGLDPLAERLGDRSAARRADLERRIGIRERKAAGGASLADYQLVAERGGAVPAGSSSRLVLIPGMNNAAAASIAGMICIDSTRWASIPGKTVNYRLVAQVATGNVAPGVNLPISLYPVTGTSGATSTIPTLGTQVSGTVCAFNTPAATTVSALVTTSDFTLTDGLYVICVDPSGAVASNSAPFLRARLEAHRV